MPKAAKKAGYKNPIVVGRYMRKNTTSKYAHVRREYERLMVEAKKKFELTHERAVEDLYKLRDDAWGKGAFNAAIQAQGLLLKVGGLIVDRREVLHGKDRSNESARSRKEDFRNYLERSRSGLLRISREVKSWRENNMSGRNTLKNRVGYHC